MREQSDRTFFASDNNASVDPAVMSAIAEANRGHAVAYGDDPYTREAEEVFKQTFGPSCEVFFVYNGTGANVLGMAGAVRSFNSILAADIAHATLDECAAPEHFLGAKLVPFASKNGKLTTDVLEPALHAVGFEHSAQPKIVTITEATEVGTVYRVDEIRRICDFAHRNNLLVHMDGARIANAAVFLGTDLKSITADAGIDILSFGGTKNGLMFGEAVCFFNPEASRDFRYIRKQGMQLASKMRYIAVQFTVLLRDGLWKRNAESANNAAAELYQKIGRLPGIELVHPLETNGLFVKVPPRLIEPLREEYFFYDWEPAEHVVRWMCSFDSRKEDIEGFARTIEKLLQ
jgi:threonine aldolase